MVNCVPDEIIPAHFFAEGPELEPEPLHEGVPGNPKMPPELATPPELKRGQILWIRGLTRLQTQVSKTLMTPIDDLIRPLVWARVLLALYIGALVESVVFLVPERW